MKRTERRHLKENELEAWTRQAGELFEHHKREAAVLVGVLVIVGAVGLGYVAWRERVQSHADGMLADAMATADARVGPPIAAGTPGAGLSFASERDRAVAAAAKFKAAADGYPSTDAGIFARYQQAATEMTLGDPTAAAQAYQEVINRAGSNVYGQMARLGLATAQARTGQYDQAITTFKELSQRTDNALPVDAVLMQLGQTYLDAGKRSEAQQAFNRIVEEFPDSPFSGDAKRQLDNLKKT